MNRNDAIRKLYKLVEEDVQKTIYCTDKYKEISNRRNIQEQLLEISVDESTFEVFEDYIDCENEMSILDVEESFVYGFSLAIRLMLDSLK